MGHFIISLASGRRADVRFGRIIQKSFSVGRLFRREAFTRSEKKAYMVKLLPEQEGNIIYQLYRSSSGEWLEEGAAGDMAVEIRRAIDAFEEGAGH